jgi:hypothetical protein
MIIRFKFLHPIFFISHSSDNLKDESVSEVIRLSRLYETSTVLSCAGLLWSKRMKLAAFSFGLFITSPIF